MKKMLKTVKENREKEIKKPVENFMGGTSYKLNPLDTLKIVAASSIFGEPAYYRSGISENAYCESMAFGEFSILPKDMEGLKTSDLMEKAIDDALAFDFGGVLELADKLRNEFYMRLNPQIIMVRAASHPSREKFTKENPGKFAEALEKVLRRADEPGTQLTYYLYKNGNKKGIPNILKKGWAKRLSKATRYEVNKYKSTGIGIKDVVRICHANSETINELMKNGTIEIKEDESTWENLRSNGFSWEEIFAKTKVPHMAILRNLRGIIEENDTKDKAEFIDNVLSELTKGVTNGKQFPFRYMSAIWEIEPKHNLHARKVLKTLENCLELSMENIPKLSGRTACLSDNSGSAYGAFNSQYGTVCVADISNLSSVLSAKNSDEGWVGVFGDRLDMTRINKEDSISTICNLLKEKGKDSNIGHSTEAGLWEFWKKAIEEKQHWDNILIYSDQQAGHNRLYDLNRKYYDIPKLIEEYRQKVNPKVNVLSVQVAGYDNVVVPENGYRTAITTGWTGKEILYLSEMIKFWDEKEKERANS